METGEIPDAQITGSTSYPGEYYAWYGRLYELRGVRAWCPRTINGDQFLKVRTQFELPRIVNSPIEYRSVTSSFYKLLHSNLKLVMG